MKTLARLLVVATVLLGSRSVASQAQTVGGVVVATGGVPVPGVVVQLLDSASNVVGRSLSDATGAYRVSSPTAGAYRLQTLRIGFRPVTSDAIRMAAGESVTRQIVLAGIQFLLDTVRVVGRNACSIRSDSSAAIFAVWDQVRTALAATNLTARSGSLTTATVRYARLYNPTMATLLEQAYSAHSDSAGEPWSSLSVDSLHTVGYVATGSDDSVAYRAPGLEVLASNTFIDDHCFRFVASTDSSRLGIVFDPVPTRSRTPEIHGTVWLDRKSSELRRMEFGYANVSSSQARIAGGSMDFTRLRGGDWLISRWEIHMPQIGLSAPGGRVEMTVTRIKAVGGALSSAARTNDTLWVSTAATLVGSVVDSASGDAVRDARVTIHGTQLQGTTDRSGRFSIPGATVGARLLDIHTTSLDSLNVVVQSSVVFVDSTPVTARVPTLRQMIGTLCGASRARTDGSDFGVIVGQVRARQDSSAVGGEKVTAQWSGAAADSHVASANRRIDAFTDVRGSFRVCGVPLNVAVSLIADGDTSRSVRDVRLTPGIRVARAQLTTDAASRSVEMATVPTVPLSPANGQASRASATNTSGGSVTVHGVAYDSVRKVPLSGAFVAIVGASMSTTSDSLGRFRFDNVPPGEYTIATQHAAFDSIGLSGASSRVVVRSGGDTVHVGLPSFATLWRTACGLRSSSKGNGFVFGTVSSAVTRRGISGALIRATWVEGQLDSTALTYRRRNVETHTDSLGSYSLCDVPATGGLSVRASLDDAASGLIELAPGDIPIQRLDLSVAVVDSTRPGIVVGSVVAEGGKPIADASVSLEGAQEVRTGTDGRFTIRNAPAGTRQVAVRAIGMTPAGAVVDVVAGDTAIAALQLQKIVTLSSVSVEASAVRRRIVQDFMERKKVGLGFYKDSVDLATQTSIANTLRIFPSVSVTAKGGSVTPTLPSVDGGVCLANIWIDGLPADAELLGMMRPDEIGALEVYPRALTTPAQFAVPSKPLCGAVVVWTKFAFP